MTPATTQEELECGSAAGVFDVIVVGGGFAGLFALHRLREHGFRVRLIEAASGIGGTWYQNRYPGCRCDIDSVDYSYSFSDSLQQEWSWTERYASQPEILGYLEHVVERFALRPDIQLNTRIVAATWLEETTEWSLESSEGEVFRSTFVVMATGVLSAAQVPDFPGLSDFDGEVHHTSAWPRQSVNVAGRRIGVIGTGSSGTQLIPRIAELAAELRVFQRTAHFVVPARNRPLDPEALREWKEHYGEHRLRASRTRAAHNQLPNWRDHFEMTPEERRLELERRWELGGLHLLRSFADVFTSQEANDAVADFLREKIREIVDDPETAALLTPKGFPLGTKRLCSGTGYYETFNRANVALVDLGAEPIDRITARGVRTSRQEYALDVLVLATGFDAMTGSLARIDIRGVDAEALREHWRDGPLTLFGVMVQGFPNMFVTAGPGSPSVLGNMVAAGEQHVRWIADLLVHMRERGLRRVEPDGQAESEWTCHVDELADRTLFRLATNSWYVGGNVPGKPRRFMAYLGGHAAYGDRLAEVAESGYAGFDLTWARAGVSA